MRRATAVVMTAVMVCVSCGDDAAQGPTPSGTAIRTVPVETTLVDENGLPIATPYPTLPSVTATPPLWTPAGWQTVEVERFEAIVYEELAAVGADAEIYTESGFALLSNGTRIPLTGIAAQVAALPVEQWRAAIAAFLVDALAPANPDDYADFDVASPLLRLRVGKPEALEIDPAQVVSKELAPGLYAALVIDGPDRKVFVPLAQAALWGKTSDELLTIGEIQTMIVTETPTVDGDFTSLTDDVFAASRIVDPASLIDPIGPGGLLIVISNADVFVAAAVSETLDLETLAGIVAQGKDDYRTRLLPASDDLYWWHDGILEVVATSDGTFEPQEALALALGIEPTPATDDATDDSSD